MVMNTEWKRAAVVLAALALIWVGPAVADEPVPPDNPDAGTAATDDLEKLLDNLSPEQVESLFSAEYLTRPGIPGSD